MKHNLFSRFIGVLLAVVMLASLMSMPSLANTVPETDSTVAGQTQTVDQDQTVTEDTEGEEVTVDDQNDSTPADGGTEVTEPTEGEEVTTPAEDGEEETTPPEDSEEVKEPAEGNEEGTTPAGDDSEEGTAPSESGEEPAEPAEDSTESTEATDAEKLYDALMAVQSVDEAESVLAAYTTEQQESMVASFSEEQLAAVKDHLQEVAEKDAEPLETKVFTDAGPLMPPVTVSSAKMARAMARSAALNSIMLNDDNGTEPKANDDLVYTKTLKDWDKQSGTGTIVIDAYAKGQYTIIDETKSVPVDIVLVLDQSGSMAYDFDGGVTRQAALKTAVNRFITSVSEKYGEKSDHRMAIVEFGSQSDTLAGWTEMDTEGAQTLHNAINRLPQEPEGATNIASGMQSAENLLVGNGYNYSGDNKTRHKVVIVFTDGVPTTSSAFNTGVADDALVSAVSMKNQGVTVYSVGIFEGADPAVLYDSSCKGNVGEEWSALSIFGLFGDVDKADVAAGNRFLNYLSSNFSNANTIGLSRRNWSIIVAEYVDYTITKNFDRSSDKYYLTANDQDSLNQIFETIKEEIGSGSTTVTLDASSIVKDVMTDYFVVDTSDGKSVQAYAVPSTDGVNFDESVKNYDGITVNPSDGKTVTVTGFDFSEKYVAATGRPRPGSTDDSDNSYHGEKLHIEIPIKVDYTKTLGGNNIPTNETDSGIYMNSSAENPVASFDPCKANVNVNFNFATEDSTVYVYQDANLEEQFSSNATYNDKNVPVDGSTNKYVTITYTVKDGDDVIDTYVIPAGQTEGNWTGSGTVTDMTECTQYTVTCVVDPSEAPAEGKDGAKAYKGEEAAWVHVVKPTIKWQDSTEDYKTQLTDDFLKGHNVGEIVWGDINSEHSIIPDPTPVNGGRPALEFDYTLNPEATTDQDGTPLLTEETVVSVAVKLKDGTDITEYTTFEWQAGEKCPESESRPTNGQFRIHLGSGDITISKKVSGNISNNLKNTVFRFQVVGEKGFSTTVAIKCPGANQTASVTLKNLPADTYTITELPSPGFTLTTQNNVKVSVNENVSFTNTCDGDDWHGDSSSVPNTFTYKNNAWQYVQGNGTK